MYEFERLADERFAATEWQVADDGVHAGDFVLLVTGHGVFQGRVAHVRGGRVSVELGGRSDHALVGTAEVAELLDVERPRIGRWVGRGQMPRPVAMLRASPVWRRRDIEAMREDVESRRKRLAA